MGLIIPTLMYHSVHLESNDYLTVNRKNFYEQGPSTRGQPDATRVERARVFAREVMEKISLNS